jgi:hypothetical protein
MFDPHKFAAADKRSKEARRAERKALKLAKREIRKAARMFCGMASKQPPMPVAVARIIREI